MKKLVKRRQPDLTSATFSDDIPPLLQRVYAARGVTDGSELENHLKHLPTPNQLKGVDKAVELLCLALQNQQSLLIVGDFDCDGATSTALGILALRAMGYQRVDYLVPNRFDYGYGLTPEIVELASANKPDLIITVDNGISSITGVAAAQQMGIKVIVTDHHLPGEQLPKADAIVNPNQPGCDFPSKNLAGVGVIFYLLSALRAKLRDSNWFAGQGIAEPSMATWLDLVALGTVADVVPLDRTNRILVHQGLQRIRAGCCRPGILALMAAAGRDYRRAVAMDFGFFVGPRLNAAGRLDDISHGIECLLTDSPDIAREFAQELDGLNRDRKLIEAQMQKEAAALVDQLQLDKQGLPWGLCLYNPDWHQGVVGLLASRIKEKVHRPVIAFADESDGVIKGSARSIPGLHIRDALDAVAARHPGLLSKFGGHAMAAGMSLPLDKLDEFKAAFDDEVRRQLCDDDLQAVLHSDGEMAAGDFTLERVQQLRDGGPWGQQFPEPVFDGEFRLVQQRIVGEKHLKLVVANASGEAIDAIAFNIDLGQWPATDVERVRCVFKPDINEWRGNRSVQLIVEQLEKL
ncbi:single-stranded-DNA-specific exonuclease RecJ [Porticoccus sp. W117]|uniref:single-stranded-DNA-specific exonuclease RecJ n=1 Tax=Porticoccus sp. W117 TaxID=3054777 RepID=UPI0025966AE1|nr:single-stranded-DNA-specific exonuclease RecJ [Porticoccus sp. W117]MDM3869872.1 single-stranded-DNA-specific exonuclease RecJ [Porticoccus sp. W117]